MEISIFNKNIQLCIRRLLRQVIERQRRCFYLFKTYRVKRMYIIIYLIVRVYYLYFTSEPPKINSKIETNRIQKKRDDLKNIIGKQSLFLKEIEKKIVIILSIFENMIKWGNKRKIYEIIFANKYQISNKAVCENLGKCHQEKNISIISRNHFDHGTKFKHINCKNRESISASDPFFYVVCKKNKHINEYTNNNQEIIQVGSLSNMFYYDFVDKIYEISNPYSFFCSFINRNVSISNKIEKTTFTLLINKIFKELNEITLILSLKDYLKKLLTITKT